MAEVLVAPAPARALWAGLGESGRIADVYRDRAPERGVVPDRLRALLAGLDAEHPTGLVLATCVQVATALPLLAEAGAPVADVLAGAAVVALAATDEGPGGDLTALATSVEPSAAGLVLDGGKRWITNATIADRILVLARRRPGPHFTNFTWVLVPADAPGVTVEAAETELFSGAGVGHLRFDRVTVPEAAVVGGPGRGLPLFSRHIAVERLAGGYWAAALCRRVLASTRVWLAGRGELWRRDVVRDRFARALVAARQLDALAAALGPVIAERHDSGAAALLKAAAGGTVERVLDECAHLRGADGFGPAGVQRLRAEAGMFGIAGGATEVCLAGVADQAERLLAGFAVAAP